MSVRVGLFGGTFDPVHNGHISIAKAFLGSSLIDELWVLLTPTPPHKLNGEQVSYELRLEMLRLGFIGIEGVKISTVEKDLPSPSYSYKTIQHLKELHPQKKFLFCMGEDSLEQIHGWKFHKEILKEVNLLVAKRPGNTHSEVKDYILYKTNFVIHTPIEVSSSNIKELIGNENKLNKLVPEKVLEVIQREQLYR